MDFWQSLRVWRFAERHSGSRDRAILESSSCIQLFKNTACSGKFSRRFGCFLFYI